MRIIYTVLFIIFLNQLSYTQVCVGESGSITWELWQNLNEDKFSELSAFEFYPNTPDLTKTLYKSESPANYDNYVGARIRGFIKIPQTESIVFNVTGNDKSRLYISTDSTAQNLQLIAFHDDYTSQYEHDKYVEQTSSPIPLVADQYYYFECIYTDGHGGDFSNVFWKTSFLADNDWHFITAAYLHNIDCLPTACPTRGTPCDDNNAATTDDVEDGFCNCSGTISTSNNCIGDRGAVTSYQYNDISGGDLNTLYNDPNFPAMPAYSEALGIFGKPNASGNNIGHLVQGYLNVPVSGNYKFNITGDDNTILFISSDDDPANKQAHQVLVSGHTSMTQHDKYLWQTTANIYLESNQYYYVEINHKQGGGSNHFQAFWQTPFTESNIWKRIPSFYMFDYECDLACIEAGVACDDGDPFTNNDMYDGNCDCVGTPCSGPDCDSPLANYIPYEKCDKTDQLDNNESNNWLSCSVNENPNPILERGHWIKYDLGERHQLIGSQIWNYNVLGQTNKGFESVQVDYSIDGVNWTNFDNYNWPLATGESSYSGFDGPNFTNIYAQHILITSMDDTTTCRGLGKVLFSAVKCPVEGTLCDDLDPTTVNDKYNANCACKGTSLLENDCEVMSLTFGDSTLFTEVHSAIHDLSSISIIDQSSYVGFIAGDYIELNPGFETSASANFLAIIDSCELILPQPMSKSLSRDSKSANEKNRLDNKKLQVIPLEDSDQYILRYYLDLPQHAKLEIVDQSGEVLHVLVDKDYKNKGFYSKRIRTKKLASGQYVVKLTTDVTTEIQKLVVL